MSFEDPALIRRATSVGTLSALPADQALAVIALREWSVQKSAPRGSELGLCPQTSRHLEQLMALFALEGRRKLVCHAPQCPCVGADEAVFANFLATAGSGDREDAMLMAMLLLRADLAPLAVSLAQTLSLELQRAGRHQTSAAPTAATTWH